MGPSSICVRSDSVKHGVDCLILFINNLLSISKLGHFSHVHIFIAFLTAMFKGIPYNPYPVLVAIFNFSLSSRVPSRHLSDPDLVFYIDQKFINKHILTCIDVQADSLPNWQPYRICTVSSLALFRFWFVKSWETRNSLKILFFNLDLEAPWIFQFPLIYSKQSTNKYTPRAWIFPKP